MKKKGFTLIELLAVIVVLAVIALITVPTILGVIEKTRKNSLLNSAYGLIESANLYAAQYGMNSVSRFDIENGVQTSTKKLSYKGKVENGTVLINEKGEVTVCVNSKNYSAYKNYKDSKVTLVDNKNCTWEEKFNQVYLDGEKTIDEYTNQELTELVTNLQGEITLLKDKSYSKTEVDHLVNDLNEKIEQINTTIIENNNNQAVINNNLQEQIDELNTNLETVDIEVVSPAIKRSICRVYKKGGFYRLRMVISLTGSIVERKIISNIPEGYRPAYNIEKTIVLNNRTVILTIWTNGTVGLSWGSGEYDENSWLYIDETFLMF